MCVICLKAIGCGMRLILYTNLKIAGYWMKALSVQRMGGLISSTPNGDGNPKIATCQGIFPINFPFFQVGFLYFWLPNMADKILGCYLHLD